MNIILRLNKIIPKYHRNKIFILVFLILVGSIVELFSFGVLIPLIALFLNRENFLSFLNIEYINELPFDYLVISFSFLIIFLYLIKSIFLTFLSYKQSRTIFNLVNALSDKLLCFYINKDFDQQILENSSNKIRNIQTEINQLCLTFINQLLFLFNDFLVVSLIIVTVFIITPYSAATAILVFSISALILDKITKKKINDLSKKRHQANSDTIKVLNDIFRGIREIKSRNFEKYFISNFNQTVKVSSYSNSIYDVFVKLPRFWLEFIAVISIISFLLFSHVFLESDIISSLTIFGLAFVKLLPNINRMSSSINILRYSYISFQSVEKELNQINIHKIKKAINKNEKKMKLFKRIDFKNVFFSYPNRKQFALRNINLTINKFDCVGIYGESGSGKTTFLDTFLGLLKPNKGEILVNDISLNSESSINWRDNISYIPQEVFLVDDTIKNNITLFKKSTNKSINKIINRLNLGEFIHEQDKKINTNIGERGMKLSGGQRQRLGLARGFLDSTEIILFDEATSALDIENENNFLSLIKDNLNKRTILIVSHNKRLFKYCNKVLRFSNGLLKIEKKK